MASAAASAFAAPPSGPPTVGRVDGPEAEFRSAVKVMVGAAADAAKPVQVPSLAPPADRPWLDTRLSPSVRARLLVAAMRSEEKISLLSGSGPKMANGEIWQVHMRGIPRLGIPDMTEGDTPAGLLIGGSGVVQMPNEAALAATFSRTDAFEYGSTMGAEARATGYGVLHGPNLDLNRDPRHGRAHETFGEDPYLTGQMGVAYVEGVQSHKVIADAKHFVANTIETGRMGLDVRIDQRTLEELDLPPFRDVVEDAHVGMIMCAYNKINGVQACDHADLLDGVLRRKWGFTGIVRGDGGAAHALRALSGGLDQEMPLPFAWGDRLQAALADGEIPAAAVDAAVGHIVQTMMTYGIFDDPPRRIGADLAADSKAAERIAAHAVVLLKNERKLLPLATERVHRLAVVGSAADDLLTAGGPANSAVQGKISILEGIRARAGGSVVDFEPGVDPIYGTAAEPGYPQIASAALVAEDGKPGATAVYADSEGRVVARRTDACLCIAPLGGLLGVARTQSTLAGARQATWTAQLRIETSGVYGFDIVTNGAADLKIDGSPVLTSQDGAPDGRTAAATHLSTGTHRLEVTYRAGERWRHSQALGSAASPRLKVGWKRPPGVIDGKIAAAAAAAKRADVAIVVVRDFESEGLDRPSLGLPNDQDRLIEAVARANTNTVVVLATGAPVLMPWLERTPAVVEAWYGGTRAGAAVASVLFGDVNPSGRLPFSFPAREADLTTRDPTRFPGDGKRVEFREKLSVGYRQYAAPGAPPPLFPFGFGLSYTRFDYTGLTVDRRAFQAGERGKDGAYKGETGVTLTFTVRNLGGRAGVATPQVYVQYPAEAAEPAPLLKGFAKVELGPHQAKTVSVSLDQQAFASYDAKAGAWRIAPGTYRLRVADSATARPIVAQVRID